MPRIKLEMPTVFFIAVKIPVRITDINYGNHVGNDAFVGIIHEARLKWLQQYGYTELNIDGAGLIMSDLIIEFRNESFYGDTIEVKIGAGETGKVNFDLYYQLSSLRNDKLILLANAKTGMICYDYMHKKVIGIPENLKKLISPK